MKRRPLRILCLAIVVAPLLMGSQCGVGVPAFSGGIRMFTYEAPQESPTNSIGIGGVADTGEWIYWNVDAQHSKGTEFSFSGTTNYAGYDNHPNAADNSVWLIAVDFTIVTGGVCTSASNTVNVPVGGKTVNGVCLLPPD